MELIQSILKKLPSMPRDRASWIRFIVTILASAVLAFSLWKIVIYYWDGVENKQTYSDLRSMYYQNGTGKDAAAATAETSSADVPKITEPMHSPVNTVQAAVYAPPVPKMPYEVQSQPEDKFRNLFDINPNIVGWVKIDDTPIDYPVVQGDDNETYLYKDVRNVSNKAGSIFMDYREKRDGRDRNLILYGHEMRDKSMFATLPRYESKYFLDKHRMIHFNTPYGDYDWEIFSVYKTKTDFDYIRTDFKDDNDFEQFLKEIQGKSIVPLSDISVSPKDTILTLSTCSAAGWDYRFAVHAKLIDKK